MKLESLICIKEMLEREVEIRRIAYEKAYDSLSEAEKFANISWRTEDEDVPANIVKLRVIKKEAYNKFSAATQALDDLVMHDWK